MIVQEPGSLFHASEKCLVDASNTMDDCDHGLGMFHASEKCLVDASNTMDDCDRGGGMSCRHGVWLIRRYAE